MTYREEKAIILKDFLKQMHLNGHRQATVDFVEKIAGMEVDRFQFVMAYKEAVKTRANPGKAKGLYDYLVGCGIIRTNEQ